VIRGGGGKERNFEKEIKRCRNENSRTSVQERTVGGVEIRGTRRLDEGKRNAPAPLKTKSPPPESGREGLLNVNGKLLT